MKKYTLISIFLTYSFFNLTLNAQSPNIEWTKTFGGINYDKGFSVEQTSDEGYIITGYTESFGAGWTDVYLVKVDSTGNTEWSKTFGGSNFEEGHSVQQTNDEGYIIAGFTKTYGSYPWNTYLIKTNSNGDTLWMKAYEKSLYEKMFSVDQVSDGGYILAGHRYTYLGVSHMLYVVKTDSMGIIEWDRNIGNDYQNEGFSVQQIHDNSYVIAGWTESTETGSEDIYLVKLDTLGNTLWTKAIGSSDNDIGKSFDQTVDRGYIITGWTDLNGNNDVYLVKTDSMGVMEWAKTFGGSDSDWGYSVRKTDDNGYIICGGTKSYGEGDYDVYIVKTNSTGDTVWTKKIGGDKDDRGHSIKQTTDGGYIVAGLTNSYGSGSYDIYLIKLKPESGIDDNVTADILSNLSATPNPFFNETEIKYVLSQNTEVNVSIYSILGQEVKELHSGKQNSGIHRIKWCGTDKEEKKMS